MSEQRETSRLGHAKRFIIRRGVIAVFFGIVFAASPALAQTVTCDYDRAGTFSQYKTYAWNRGAGLTDADHERVLRAIDAALIARGLTLVEATASPDALVAYDLNFEFEGYEVAPRSPGSGGNACHRHLRCTDRRERVAEPLQQ